MEIISKYTGQKVPDLDFKEMDVKQVAEYSKLYPQTIYNLVSTGRIPYRRISEKRVVFDKNDIDEWLAHRRTRKRTAHFEEKKCVDTNIVAIQSGKRKTKRGIKKSNIGIAKKIAVSASLSLTALGIILIGAWLWFRPGKNIPKYSASLIEPAMNVDKAKINFLDFLPAQTIDEGIVQVKFDYLSKAMELEGTVGSPQIKALLIEALKNEKSEYSIKSKSIDIVQPYYTDPEIRSALLHILAHDKNPIIRMKAMSVLAKIAESREIKEALLERLKNDENMGIRYKALELIENDVDEEIMAVLIILKEKETNKIIKNRAALMCQEYENRKQKA